MKSPQILTLFLCGDVMLGRGVDQILPHPSDPAIHETYMTSALQYVKLAENKNGPIPKPVDFNYVWGDALSILDRINPRVRIINLETSITTNNDWEDKGINYRMHPNNCACLTSAKIDVCVLANNHVLDWGKKGLSETLASLHKAGIKTAGAGQNLEEASAPSIINLPRGRLLTFSIASESGGVPEQWAAGTGKAGVNFISDFSTDTVNKIKNNIRTWKKAGDIIVVSIHWGGNWGYSIPADHTSFARRLLSEADVHVIHGHSSHHIKGVEVYQNKLIIYGCGDFINDYEGIGGNEEYRGDFPVMFFPSIDMESGSLTDLRLVPMHLKKMQLEKTSIQDARWLKNILNRESEKWGTHFELTPNQLSQLNWVKDHESHPAKSLDHRL